MKTLLSFSSVFLLLATLPACATSSSPSPSPVKKIVEGNFQPLVDLKKPKDKRYQSILVGIVTPFETTIIPFGTLTDKGAAPNASTVFEIGSITKGFLGLTLAHESLNGSLDLDAPYTKKTLITWRNLAQHTAGFPRMPDNLKPANPMQPYEDYDQAKLESFLKGFRFKTKPGVKSEYSNLSSGLAGFRLSEMHKKSLEQVFRTDLLDGLSLSDTRITLSAEQEARMAPVFINGDKSEPWHWKNSALQGAGALRSTMQDMTVLLKTMMGFGDLKYLPMVNLATKPTFAAGKNSELGLFWQRLSAENIIWHNGGTYGSSSFMGYIPEQMVGIVVLSNSQFIDEMGGDPRLDIASITSLLDLAASQKMAKPLKILKDYDAEIARRNTEFAKMPENPKSTKWVQAKLTHMFDIDQIMRKLPNTIAANYFSPEEKVFFDKGYAQRFYMMDWQNTQDLKALLKIHGWFNISKWGKQSDNQAWLIVQHADSAPEFQKEILEKLSKLYKTKETEPANYAYLYDRIASSSADETKRKPQRYGTQGKCVGPGKWCGACGRLSPRRR